jgi:hypothetical protein
MPSPCHKARRSGSVPRNVPKPGKSDRAGKRFQRFADARAVRHSDPALIVSTIWKIALETAFVDSKG